MKRFLYNLMTGSQTPNGAIATASLCHFGGQLFFFYMLRPLNKRKPTRFLPSIFLLQAFRVPDRTPGTRSHLFRTSNTREVSWEEEVGSPLGLYENLCLRR